MTRRRFTGIPGGTKDAPVIRPGTEALPNYGLAESRRLQAAIRRDNKARVAAGIKAHRPEPFDPYREVEWRVCEEGCQQHGGGVTA